MRFNVQDLIARLSSRKFLLTVCAILASIFAALAEQITWDQALDAITKVVMAFIGVEGVRDAMDTYLRVKKEK